MLFLLLSRFTVPAQVGPPQLRCIEVLPNGDIKLTWIPASDPSNVFFAYEIFASISPAGPFTNVGSVPALPLTGFTHAGAGAHIQSRYYFVRSAYGAGGINKSSHSDTLRSIFLNIIPSVPDLKLQYNAIRIPRLASTSTTYTITREYPAGIWGILGITPANNYADTLSICSASLNYQVQIADNSGCVSASNVQGGVYQDKKDPDIPEIDSISVLPTGQTIIAWKIPRDPDIVKYLIYQFVGTNQPIDTVNGRNSTSYTFTSTIATSSALALYVAAIDSCSRVGSFSITPSTMHLKTSYDRCGYRAILNWNAYPGMKNGVLEYRVYYSVNGSVFTKVGSTASTSFVHQNVAPNSNICYFVRVVNNGQTITASSNRTCFYSVQVPAAAFVYLRNASVTGPNSSRLDLYLDTSRKSTGIDIERSVDGVSFTNIGSVAVNNEPFYAYFDDDAPVSSRAVYYRAVARDSCGNARTLSNIAKTIHLSVKEDKEQVFLKHLSWNAYSGYSGGVSGYNIYRIVNRQMPGSPTAFAGFADTSFTDNIEDEAPNGADVGYLVQAVEGIGNIYGFLESSFSNTVAVYQEDRIFIPAAFAPSGRNKIWKPVTHFVDLSDYHVLVFNRWGSKVFETTETQSGWDGANCPPGVYVYLITYRNSRGEYKEEKGNVLLLE